MARLILISGHNGRGTGAKGYIDEGTETIVLRDAIYNNLINKGVPKDIIITDKGSDNVVLSKIVNWIKSFFYKDDLCVDLHFNASANHSANGCEVLIPNKHTVLEKEIATKISKEIAATLSIKNRGVKTEKDSQHNSIAMLSSFDCVNILLEICFITNKNDTLAYTKKFDELVENISTILYEYKDVPNTK